MRIGRRLTSLLFAWWMLSTVAFGANNDSVLQPITERFKSGDVEEVPDFQRHVTPLLGRLGCNGRACHGSFQGRGGFRLSLFGYDFNADFDAMTKGDKPRVNVKEPLASLIIAKPTDENIHEGGERYTKDSWQYNIFRRWIETGAKYEKDSIIKLERLEVTPAEIVSHKSGEKIQLKAVAVWANGAKEDVTPLCRFISNDDQVAKIDENGLITTTERGDTHAVVFYDSAVVPVPVLRPVSTFVGDKYPQVTATTPIDKHVANKLSKLGIVPSTVCSDADFLRRVSLDLTGTLPAASDVEAFLANPSPNKRSEKVNELLETPAYAAWWTTRLCDFTGNNQQQLNNVGTVRGNTSQEWYDWIYKRVSNNVAYDELAAGIIMAVSRNPGESYADYCQSMTELYQKGSDKSFADREYLPYFWGRRNFRQTEERAIGFAYTFMGIRIQCAQCHKHPFDQWSKDDFDQFKAFFTTVKAGNANTVSADAKKVYNEMIEELGLKNIKGNQERTKAIAQLLKEGKTIPFGETYVDPVRYTKRKTKDGKEEVVQRKTAKLLGGDVVDLGEVEDVRKPLMDWLRASNNPFFAKAFVNRVWANYFNVGIVQPPDDLSLANPPSNKPLLDYLSQGFIANKFDMKWLHREICASDTYQRSWQTNDTNAKDERNFSRAVPRRLPAEVTFDALQLATASDAKAAKGLYHLKDRAISVAGSSARDGGGGDSKGFALAVFGRSIRESNCDCDRSMESSLLQTVFLQNDQSVLTMVNGGRDSWCEQLTKQFNAKENGTQPERLEAKLAELKQAAKDSQGEGEGKKRRELSREITETEQRLERARKEEAKSGTTNNSPSKLDGDIIIRQAYLRTLSRYPSDDEMARCREHIAASPNLVEGAKGLLWALVNTKEFIVNH